MERSANPQLKYKYWTLSLKLDITKSANITASIISLVWFLFYSLMFKLRALMKG